MIVFGKMNLFQQLVIISYVILFNLMLIFIIDITSSVNTEANKSFKILNSVLIYSNKILSIRTRIKVSIKYIPNCFQI